MTVAGDALLDGVIRGRHESEPVVVARRLLIDGTNEHADAAGLGVDSLRPGQGVDQQQFAEALPLALPVNGKAARSDSRDAPWQLSAPHLPWGTRAPLRRCLAMAVPIISPRAIKIRPRLAI